MYGEVNKSVVYPALTYGTLCWLLNKQQTSTSNFANDVKVGKRCHVTWGRKESEQRPSFEVVAIEEKTFV